MKNKSKFIILALIMLISVIGISYAFFVYYKVGDNSSKLIFGDIYLKLNSGSDSITLLNVFPETKEKARSRTDNQITFTVSGINTTTNKDIWYEIMLNEGNEVSGRTRFNTEDLVFDLIEVNEDNTETYLVDAQSYGDINAKRIWVETVDRNTTTEVNKTYKLRMWLSEDVFISDTNPNATYDVETFESSYASVKVSVYGDFVEKYLLKGYIIYDLSSLGLTNLTSTPIYTGQVTTLTTEVPFVNGYKFLGWSTTLNGEVVYQSGGKINESDTINDNLILYPVMKVLESFVSKITSTISLTSADSDGTKFVYGDDVDNNYVWYSGKLWRILSIDKSGNIKLVTQGNVTSLAWASPSGNGNYYDKQIYNWLQNEFLPILYDAENLLVSSTWEIKTYTSFPTEKLTTTTEVTSKVGLINIYEFMKTGGTNSSSTTNTFLNNGYYWWTISAYSASGNIWYINNSGVAASAGSANSVGVRPSVNLKSGIKILGGTGEKTDPYTIEGDKLTGVSSELLSNRISGEYISFNNTKYRIVGIEEINGQKLTKVTMADYDVNKNSLVTSVKFGASTSQLTYSPTYGIGLYLQEWYQADSTSETYANTYINDIYKAMIATDGIEWYTGPTTGAGNDYTKSKTGTIVETPIGLGYYGEMFSGQFGDGSDSSTDVWLITKYSSSYIWTVRYNDNAYYYSPTKSYGVRPSFYLKSDVKITGGTGMPHNPYSISQ